MSYDIYLADPATHEPLELEAANAPLEKRSLRQFNDLDGGL